MGFDRIGYIQVYCGNGKGKTTAALGLSLRTLLSGGSVFFAQFCKGSETAEMGLCSLFDTFVIEQYGTGNFIINDPTDEDRKQARTGLEHCRSILSSGHFDMVVLDEIILCVFYQLVTIEEIISMIRSRKPWVEVVLTGRKAPQELIDAADLVTEMKKIKHYFDRGVKARKGIEF
ncbi:MAG TPA: cob(I)yrinic acid a,c-diamide adenosyltransferase [Methanospirillum sp.]|uniref:cob(I)yrinic acid a,c-diamide adenosyltransferase n=1 Tax=Methanospirillum sp. TaxID=45200 RepID=UPI002BFC078C|nr:cob(I)yrinic acid a,c-diamide adenosyltransferase [Methanospirillum sp.]HOJ95629.1 cob(I)yrinic acid a,c-diamide adenosyltransferase [Methanospirillum sp.]HPP77133.1 cob(I)yrinic acid a,c-diamide adenosyltransferase [Methanospirillum sp.]